MTISKKIYTREDVLSMFRKGENPCLVYKDEYGRVHHVETANENELHTILDNLPEGKIIEDEKIYPPHEEWMELYTGEANDDVYVKAGDLDYIGESDITPKFIKDEIKAYQTMDKAGIVGVPKYYGCVVEDGFVKGIAITKFSIDLDDLDRSIIQANADSLKSQLTSVVQSLHAIDIVHGDISPNNIMLDKNMKLFLIDFDSSGPEMYKGGTSGYMRDGYCKCKEDDLYSVERVKDFIDGKLEL